MEILEEEVEMVEEVEEGGGGKWVSAPSKYQTQWRYWRREDSRLGLRLTLSVWNATTIFAAPPE